jgi:carbon monoxide dehydrogenase subunit G
MKLGGHTRLNAPRSEVWKTLTDPERITPLLPSGEIVEEDGETWRARLSAPTTLGTSTFDFVFSLVEKRPEEHVSVKGHGYGSQNVIDLTAKMDLSDAEGGTEVRWECDALLGGVLASLGQRSLPYVLQRQIENVLKAVERQQVGASV